MEPSSNGQCRLRFGFFEVDLNTRELYKRGLRVHLQDQPFQILTMLLEHPGTVIGRDQLQKKLWPYNTFVEFDKGLNTAIKKLRHALGDSADNPCFIETVPRQGYRFIAPVEGLRRDGNVGGQQVYESFLPLTLPESKDRHRRVMAALSTMMTMILLAAGVGAVAKWLNTSKLQLHLEKMSIEALTDSSKATNAAISPDGKFVVYTLVEGERQSLRLKQVGIGSEFQLLAPDKVQFLGETFSPDGSYIFFVRSDQGNVFWRSLYQMPTLGGIPRQVVRDVDTPISISPDGKHFAFLRGNYPKQREDYLVVGNFDSGERVLATRRLPLHFGGSEYPPTGGPVWSPDGRTIAVAVTDPNKHDHHSSVLVFSLSDGKSKEIYATESQIGRLQWLPGGHGLLLVIADGRTGLGGQLWQLSYPAGEARKFTNDLSSYDPCCLDLTADLRIAAVQVSVRADLWIVEDRDTATARQLTSGQPVLSNSWIKPNEIVFSSVKGEIYAMDLQDPKPTLLLADGHNNADPSACGDGGYIVFMRQSPSSGRSLWRMRADGTNVTQLTHGKFDEAPVCSADGKWVIYESDAGAPGSQTTLWRVSIDGGAPARLTQDTAYRPRVSPDGKMILYYKGGDINTPMHVAVIPADGGQHSLSFPLPVGASNYNWSPDGRSLDYTVTQNAVSNVWRKPLNGSSTRRLTDFKAGRIFAASWSQDGTRLLVSRGEISNDVVIISPSEWK